MVAVIADSAANLPSELAGALGIQIVPMYLRFGEVVYRDGTDLTPADFYRRLVSDREAASTSTPSPGDFLEAYRRTGQREVVCVTVASVMSAVYHEATMAADRWDGRVEVVDSMTASMAEGFVALEAARVAASGASLERVAAAARTLAPRTSLFATVDTFEFLQRSGRVKRLQAYAATMLDIKPVFKFQGGQVTPVARPRTRRRALDRIVVDSLAEIDGRPVHLASIHAAAPEAAASLIERISASANVVEELVVEVTPVIGAHTGPGLVGTAFYCEGDKLAR
jgi:DegV family protein with EDD domain